ncbi:MAG: phosphate ABC transporter substrate-binding/OmpA family protein [Roseobacter sp.]
MRWNCAALCAALSLFVTGGTGYAQDVVLSSRDGQVEITGTLLGFDGEFYRLETVYGEMTVDGSGVNCAGPGCPNLQDFVADIAVSGSATMGALLVPALLEGFAQRNGFATTRDDIDETHFTYTLIDSRTDKRVAIFRFRTTNSDEGFADLLVNEADVVMSLREIRSEEQARAQEAGMGDLTHPNRSRVLALDAIVPIVSPQNPVTEISPQDLAAIYAGQVTNWSKLGGPNAPIALHAPAAQSGLGQAAEDRLFAPAGVKIAPVATRHIRGDSMARAVVRDPFAIGLASYAETGNAQSVTLKGSCGRVLNATRRSIKTEDYPLTAPMFLYTPARRLPKIGRDFMAFALGPIAQIVIRRAGFVDQAAEEVPIDQQGNRFANAILGAGEEVELTELQRMTRVLSPMKRLTISFRFEAGSTRLDAQSRSNVVQVARDLERGLYDARRLLFVGFSDGQGPAERNRQIAFERAEAVRDAVVNAAETADLLQVDVQVDAFGEALPLACDNSAWGRQANRRVEVWVR